MNPCSIPRLLAACALSALVVGVTAAEPARRVVTLAPHLSELVFDAGAGELLVGVIDYSDYPPAVLDLPRVGDAFGVNREVLAGLAPDLILAWSGLTPTALVARLEEDGHRVVVLGAQRPEDVADALVEIGRLTGQEALARARAEAYRERLAGLRRRYGERRPVRVFVQLAPRPLYTVNDRQMIGQVVRLCGGSNVFGDLRQLTPVVEAEAVLAADPEVVLSTDGGEGDPFDQWRRFPALPAVASDRLYRLTADWITRPSLRLARGAAETCGFIDEARTSD